MTRQEKLGTWATALIANPSNALTRNIINAMCPTDPIPLDCMTVEQVTEWLANPAGGDQPVVSVSQATAAQRPRQPPPEPMITVTFSASRVKRYSEYWSVTEEVNDEIVEVPVRVASRGTDAIREYIENSRVMANVDWEEDEDSRENYDCGDHDHEELEINFDEDSVSEEIQRIADEEDDANDD